MNNKGDKSQHSHLMAASPLRNAGRIKFKEKNSRIDKEHIWKSSELKIANSAEKITQKILTPMHQQIHYIMEMNRTGNNLVAYLETNKVKSSKFPVTASSRTFGNQRSSKLST